MPGAVTQEQLCAIEEAARKVSATSSEVADLYWQRGSWPADASQLAAALVAAWYDRECRRPWTVEEILRREG